MRLMVESMTNREGAYQTTVVTVDGTPQETLAYLPYILRAATAQVSEAEVEEMVAEALP